MIALYFHRYTGRRSHAVGVLRSPIDGRILYQCTHRHAGDSATRKAAAIACARGALAETTAAVLTLIGGRHAVR